MAAADKSEINVPHLAALARVELTDADVESFQTEIESILGYVKLLAEVDVTDVEPTAHATHITNVIREDAVGQCADHHDAMANAPDTLDDELIRVPVVISDDDAGGP